MTDLESFFGVVAIVAIAAIPAVLLLGPKLKRIFDKLDEIMQNQHVIFGEVKRNHSANKAEQGRMMKLINKVVGRFNGSGG